MVWDQEPGGTVCYGEGTPEAGWFIGSKIKQSQEFAVGSGLAANEGILDTLGQSE